MGRQDAELIAVFGDGSACYLDALGLELFFDGCVGEGFGGVLVTNQLLDSFTDPGVGNFRALLGGVA